MYSALSVFGQAQSGANTQTHVTKQDMETRRKRGRMKERRTLSSFLWVVGGRALNLGDAPCVLFARPISTSVLSVDVTVCLFVLSVYWEKGRWWCWWEGQEDTAIRERQSFQYLFTTGHFYSARHTKTPYKTHFFYPLAHTHTVTQILFQKWRRNTKRSYKFLKGNTISDRVPFFSRFWTSP